MQYPAQHDDNFVSIIGFWHPDEEFGCFSNWYPAEFDYAHKHFTSIEQYMMYHKVLMFRQYDLAEMIMRTNDPSECKKIGRTKFPEFDSSVWEKTGKAIVKRGIKAKFRQNDDMLRQLLDTGNALLAECSPYDSKWGIGIGTDNPEWWHARNWRGRNLLGRILMEVREELGRELHAFSDGCIQINESYYSEMIPEWQMPAGLLKRIPQYYQAIHAYSDTLLDNHARNGFYNDCSLAEVEYIMETNMGGGLPVIGFYEMKQDVYDTALHLRCGCKN